MLRVAVLGLSLAACLFGCGDQTGVPQPQPVPGPLSDFVRRSTPSLTATEPRTMVVGLAGAVAGVGEVQLTRVSTGEALEALATAAGTFSLVIPGGKGDQLELRYANDDGVSEPLVLPGLYSQGGPSLEGARNSDDQLISLPDASGNVTVTNDFDPVPLVAAANADLIASNGSTGVVVVSRTDAAGRNPNDEAAASGDPIQLMLVDPNDPGATSDFRVLTVP